MNKVHIIMHLRCHYAELLKNKSLPCKSDNSWENNAVPNLHELYPARMYLLPANVFSSDFKQAKGGNKIKVALQMKHKDRSVAKLILNFDFFL